MKSKFLKRASLVALAGVMVAGVAVAAAGCGGGTGSGGGSTGYRTGTPGRGTDPNTLTVYIFCNDADAATNRQICNAWMDKYNAAHNTNYKVSLTNLNDKQAYFDNLSSYWSSNNMYDIMYLAPRYVRSYAETGSVLNLADYLDKVTADPSVTDTDQIVAANKAAFGDVWKNAYSYYAYQRGKAKTQNGVVAYSLGQPVSYVAAQNGFYADADNSEVEIYGLPKDYSNFSTGYNKLFFSDEMKAAITSTIPATTRNVRGAGSETTGSVSSERTYNANSGRLSAGGSGKSIIQYAVDVTADQSHDGQAHAAGDAAAIINPGVPTRYFPFNFFRFNTYYDALKGGDPMALMCQAYTNGEGYVVTIPGFPNDTFKLANGTAVDENAPYDTSIGHITYTYAEYSAFIWAMTYYLNTFDGQPFPGGEEDGFGGTSISGQGAYVIFGGEQYEGKSAAAVGSVLYLLPWLYGNDADLIDTANLYCTSLKDGNAVTANPVVSNPAEWRNYVGDDTNIVSKMNLDGTYREASVQYGYDSQSFIETYGAFLALGSDWNANNGGDSDSSSSYSGWDYFRAGRSLFYGAGSWDGATRNDTDPTVLEFGQMPTPVSEKYALYSSVKGANYTMEVYSNGATAKGTSNGANDDSVQRTNLADGLKYYDTDAIIANQTLRQDKWGARMDSVGYAVNGQVTNYTGAHAWKEEAAVSLVMALTIDPAAQVSLTYAGAQYPNFISQSMQFVDYQKYGEDGAFKDMLTPEGFSNMQYYNEDGSVNETVAAQAKTIWEGYYDLARQMQELARAKSSQTVGEFLQGKKVAGEDVKYNHTYDTLTFANFSGSTTTAFLANGMKVLNMIAMWRDDREINLRMQYGLNAVRDSTMYTYNDEWVGKVDARGATDTMLAYNKQKPLAFDGTKLTQFMATIKQDPSKKEILTETPFVYCLRTAQVAQDELTRAIALENNALNKR